MQSRGQVAAFKPWRGIDARASTTAHRRDTIGRGQPDDPPARRLCATIRPIEPADKSRHADTSAELGPAALPGLLTSIDARVEREPAYLTDIDHREYDALVAIEPETGWLRTTT